MMWPFLWKLFLTSSLSKNDVIFGKLKRKRKSIEGLQCKAALLVKWRRQWNPVNIFNKYGPRNFGLLTGRRREGKECKKSQKKKPTKEWKPGQSFVEGKCAIPVWLMTFWDTKRWSLVALTRSSDKRSYQIRKWLGLCLGSEEVAVIMKWSIFLRVVVRCGSTAFPSQILYYLINQVTTVPHEGIIWK